MKWSTFIVLVLLALALALGYRIVDLGLRPMHTDEAILGIKFLDFWKTGVFDYDPRDYHGPFLHYLTRGFAWVLHWQNPALVTETELRLVVAMCGLLLVLSTLLLIDALGRMATAMAMLMMAVSPMMVFYSRYFIMEVPFVLLLALFMIGCWRYSQGKGKLWLLVAGFALGAAHATKETCLINFCAMLCGWIAARVVTDGFAKRSSGMSFSMGRNRGESRMPGVWVALIGIIVSVTFFSGFFQHRDDVIESITTYAKYWQRSGGAGGHEKPWHYYLGVMFWTKSTGLWTEAMIGGLALVGMGTAFFGSFGKETHRQAFLVFLSVYALAALTAYSIIPYKTPWSILSVQWALTLLAGVGARSVYRLFQAKLYRLVAGMALTVGIYHFCAQTKLTIYDPIALQHNLFRANLNSPYVYSHTSENAMKLVKRLRELAALNPKEFSAQVINQDSGWPLPWYLRDVSNVGYQMAVPSAMNSPVIVVDGALTEAVKAKLPGKEFVEDSFILRPNVLVTLLVDKAVWARYLESKSSAPATP